MLRAESMVTLEDCCTIGKWWKRRLGLQTPPGYYTLMTEVCYLLRRVGGNLYKDWL